MDFVAPSLLEHYIGGTYYGGAGTRDDPVDLVLSSSDDEEGLEEQAQQDDPVDLVSSDDEEALEEQAQDEELPTHVPVVELRDIKLRAGKDGSGYDRNLKMKNWALDKSSGYTVFQMPRCQQCSTAKWCWPRSLGPAACADHDARAHLVLSARGFSKGWSRTATHRDFP